MPWIKASFKGTEVLARCDDQGRMLKEAGRVEIRYRAEDKRTYRAGIENLRVLPRAEVLPEETCAQAEVGSPRGTKSGAGKAGTALPQGPGGAIIVYADGACSGNPGPAGVGIVIIDGERRRELSHYLGEATNNIAELTAIELAARAIDERDRPLRIYTDSQYAIGVLSKGWKAKANVEIVMRTRKTLGEFTDLALHYVRGHSGIPLNERADALAVAAVENRVPGEWMEFG